MDACLPNALALPCCHTVHPSRGAQLLLYVAFRPRRIGAVPALLIHHLLLHRGSSFYVIAVFGSLQSNLADAVVCGSFMPALTIS